MATISIEPQVKTIDQEVDDRDHNNKVRVIKGTGDAQKTSLRIPDMKVRLRNSYDRHTGNWENDGFDMEKFVQLIECRGATMALNNEYGGNDLREATYTSDGVEATFVVEGVYQETRRVYKVSEKHVTAIFEACKCSLPILSQIQIRRNQKKNDTNLKRLTTQQA
jgi:hypothetical protein